MKTPATFALRAGCAMFLISTAFAAEPKPDFEKQIVPLLGDYCYDCHGEGAKKVVPDVLFPADDPGYGFDTIGDVLSISPLLMEKYVVAAEEIVSKVSEEGGPRIPTLSVGGENFRVGDGGKKTAKYLPFAEP